MRIRLAASLVAFAASAAAQISVTATAIHSHPASGVELSASGAANTSIPVGTNVAAGFSMLLTGAVQTGQPQARAVFSLTTDATASNASFAASVSVPHSIGVSQLAEATTRGAIELVYTSPIPIAVDVTMRIPRWNTLARCAANEGSITIAGQPTYGTLSGAGCAVDPFSWPWEWHCSQTVQATVDAAGLRIQIFARAAANSWNGSTLCNAANGASATVDVEVRPRPSATSYGASCGMTMAARPSLLDPTKTMVSVAAPAGLPSALLFVGTQQVQFPLPWNCPLLTDAVVAVGFGMRPDGTQSFLVPAPPSGVFTTQTAVFGGSTIVMSNGLQW